MLRRGCLPLRLSYMVALHTIPACSWTPRVRLYAPFQCFWKAQEASSTTRLALILFTTLWHTPARAHGHTEYIIIEGCGGGGGFKDVGLGGRGHKRHQISDNHGG